MTSLTEKYDELFLITSQLIEQETDLIANLANFAAVLYHNLNHFWVGFYLINGSQLTLGPFQGPLACTRIDFGRGVCGKSWEKNEPIIVSDVHQFPDHIACNAAPNSEIVIPFYVQNKIKGVLDIDSLYFNTFSDTDLNGLSKIVALLNNCKL